MYLADKFRQTKMNEIYEKVEIECGKIKISWITYGNSWQAVCVCVRRPEKTAPRPPVISILTQLRNQKNQNKSRNILKLKNSGREVCEVKYGDGIESRLAIFPPLCGK